jgi:hypothetical protein
MHLPLMVSVNSTKNYNFPRLQAGITTKDAIETLRRHTATDKLYGLDFLVTVPRNMYQLNYLDKLG